jgi:hypothetical protein
MKKTTLKKSVLLAIFFIPLLFSISSAALVPPCDANAYLTRYNTIGGVVTIEYFLNNEYKCSQQLTRTYATSPQMIGLTQINEGAIAGLEGIDELNELIKFFFYFSFAVIIAVVFISGIKVMNS